MENEWMICTPSLKYIKEWTEQIEIVISNPDCIVWISSLQHLSDGPPDFKVTIARTPNKDKNLWPKIVCNDQMLKHILSTDIIGGAYINKQRYEAAFALLVCSLNVLLVYLRTGNNGQFWRKQRNFKENIVSMGLMQQKWYPRGL